MRGKGPDSDIVLSSRVRLARNFQEIVFPRIAEEMELSKVEDIMRGKYEGQSFTDYADFQYIQMSELTSIEKRVLVEKHLISPHLAKKAEKAGALISENEQVSIMINEEDHLRIQLYFSGLQLTKALEEAFAIDDWIEENVNYAFDEEKGYLTSCPTNLGTGLRASVMMHLPALVKTNQMSQMIPAINQLGLVVRGIYGEGSEAIGNLFQISNQVTLGKSEEEIIEDLLSVVSQLINHERAARKRFVDQSMIRLENTVFRSYGILQHSRIIESVEAAQRISDLRLGIDLGIIENVSQNILNELMILTQPAFLQHYSKKALTPNERDVYRAKLIRERLQLENE